MMMMNLLYVCIGMYAALVTHHASPELPPVNPRCGEGGAADYIQKGNVEIEKFLIEI